ELVVPIAPVAVAAAAATLHRAVTELRGCLVTALEVLARCLRGAVVEVFARLGVDVVPVPVAMIAVTPLPVGTVPVAIAAVVPVMIGVVVAIEHRPITVAVVVIPRIVGVAIIGGVVRIVPRIIGIGRGRRLIGATRHKARADQGGAERQFGTQHDCLAGNGFMPKGRASRGLSSLVVLRRGRD